MEANKRSFAEERVRHQQHQEWRAQVRLYPEPEQIVRALESVADLESDADLQRLERKALISFAKIANPELVAPALFGVFERFPWEDGYGSFWTILHMLERTPGYQPLMVASIRRSPGDFNLSMVNRLLNAGTTRVAGTDLLALLGEIAEGLGYSTRARDRALGFLQHQTS